MINALGLDGLRTHILIIFVLFLSPLKLFDIIYISIIIIDLLENKIIK